MLFVRCASRRDVGAMVQRAHLTTFFFSLFLCVIDCVVKTVSGYSTPGCPIARRLSPRVPTAYCPFGSDINLNKCKANTSQPDVANIYIEFVLKLNQCSPK